MEYPSSKAEDLTVDQHEIKFAMAGTIVLIALSWILDSWLFAAAAALCQILGSAGSAYSPYSIVYSQIFVASRLIKKNIIPDDPVPHRFALLVGGIVTLIGTGLLLLNFTLGGWIILTLVFLLQNLNLWVNFCMMYYTYFLLVKLGIPGFKVSK